MFSRCLFRNEVQSEKYGSKFKPKIEDDRVKKK